MTKIIHITKHIKQKPLTPLMIKTLRAACEKQSKHEPFGQKDLDGSFTALLQRELIDSKTIDNLGKKEVLWFVTISGMNTLTRLGFTDIC